MRSSGGDGRKANSQEDGSIGVGYISEREESEMSQGVLKLFKGSFSAIHSSVGEF